MASRFNVRALRHSMGMTTEDLADRIGVHARTIERWESGRVAPSPLAINKLRELQHPEVPRRREFESQSQSERTNNSNGNSNGTNDTRHSPAVVAPPMGGGVVPSRRMVE